jgi:hypothetical protein
MNTTTTSDKNFGLYWDGAGRHKKAADALNERIPLTGSVDDPKKNKRLEKFRKAVNCYHDLYNNGLWNRSAEFRSVFRKYGIRVSDYRHPWPNREIDFEAIAPHLEAAMDAIIVDAAKEQGLQGLIKNANG